jgi:Fe-S oxidoreductase
VTSSASSHAQAYTYCAYCPKGCRHACPVSEASQSESLSTWGKMTAAHLVEEEQRPLDAETAEAVHACTGCLRCSSFCKHDNQAGPALFAARTQTIAAGLQPRGAATSLATFTQAQNPFGVELAALVAGWRAQSAVKYPLFPGCSALVKRPEVIEDLLVVSSAFGAPMGVARAAQGCCGYPLYAAGAHDAFREHARSMAQTLEQVPELVVLDPGCAYTFLKLYPSFGVTVKTRVRTVVEVLAENLPHAPDRPPLPETVGYHDACHLGRGLGQYDPPRALVKRAVQHLVEAPSNRREAGCSGGGGLLPRTMPEVSVEVARRQAQEASNGEDVAVVTACPTSKRMFERAGRRSFDVIGLLRRWLEAP